MHLDFAEELGLVSAIFTFSSSALSLLPSLNAKMGSFLTSTAAQGKVLNLVGILFLSCHVPRLLFKQVFLLERRNNGSKLMKKKEKKAT